MDQHEHKERFEQWVRDHGAILHHVANGFAAGDDRNDLMQELLLALWRSIPAFRSDAKPSTFIYRVSHNAAMTWRRTLRNYQTKLDQFEALSAVGGQEHVAAMDAHLLDRLYAEIRRLPPLDRSLILLSLDGVPYGEMAEIHGLSESNVGVRLNRIKHKLSTALKGVSHELR